MTRQWQEYGHISGPVLMIGFGSIGRGLLPLIERHFSYDQKQFSVIEPQTKHRTFLKQRGIRLIEESVTEDNYRELVGAYFSGSEGQGFVVNVSVDVDSLAIMTLCRELGLLYIDTVVEPWPGLYFNTDEPTKNRTNYALRERVRREKFAHPGGPTAVSCCGANPGMVSWLVKAALLHLARDLDQPATTPLTRAQWARLMRDLGVKGVHIAERDTQYVLTPRPIGTFVNTWSVEGFIAESFQPAELGWGTHEKWLPENGHQHKSGCRAAIYLDYPGGLTRVHSWCPTPGPQYGFLVTHNEAISIADYFTLGEPGAPEYRPTCHYAYHPCNDAVLSLHETFGSGKVQDIHKLINEADVVGGVDELGVLLYGHARNAYWYGSRLSMQETRELAPYQNATGLQVSSAVLAGMAWALENPEAGIVETEEMDHAACLAIQTPYLGPIEGHYTDWHPLSNRWSQFDEEIDESDPWQFKNVLAS